MACHVGLLYDLKVLVLSRTSWRVLVTCLRAKSNKTSWVHSVLRQTCSIVSAKPSLTRNSAVVEQNHFHKDYHCVCFSSYIFFCAVSCSCIPVAFQLHSSCKFQLQILFPLGETFASSSIIETWHLIRICLLVFAPANASPNVNRICNWNLQLECNWNATAHKNMQLEKHRKIEGNCLYVFM